MNNIILPERGFAKEEFEQRLIRAQKIMKSYKLDGLLLTSPQNIRYFTGYDSQFGKVQHVPGSSLYHHRVSQLV